MQDAWISDSLDKNSKTNAEIDVLMQDTEADVDEYKAENVDLTDDMVLNHALYQQLNDEYGFMQMEVERKDEEIERKDQRIADLVADNGQQEQQIFSLRKQVEDLKKQLEEKEEESSEDVMGGSDFSDTEWILGYIQKHATIVTDELGTSLDFRYISC